MQVELQQENELLIAGLSGDWEMDGPTPRYAWLLNDGTPGRMVRGIGFDTTELGTWDRSLLIFLLQARSYCDTHGLEFREEGLPKNVARLLELAQAAPDADMELVGKGATLLARTGPKSSALLDAFLASVTFAGGVGHLGLYRHPGR